MGLVRTLLVASLVAVVLALAATPAGAQSSPTLADVRAAGHPGFDRVVFEFQGDVPEHTVGYVDQLVEDGSGEPVKGREPASSPAPAGAPVPAVDTSMTSRDGPDRVDTVIGRRRSRPMP